MGAQTGCQSLFAVPFHVYCHCCFTSFGGTNGHERQADVPFLTPQAALNHLEITQTEWFSLFFFIFMNVDFEIVDHIYCI